MCAVVGNFLGAGAQTGDRYYHLYVHLRLAIGDFTDEGDIIVQQAFHA